MAFRCAGFVAALAVLPCVAEGLRNRREHPEVRNASSQGAQFRGTFRDLSLWVDGAASAAAESHSTDNSLWVVEFTSAQQMANERGRALANGLRLALEQKLSLVLQGDVPGVLGYDACGGEVDKTVISVADHEVVESSMPLTRVLKYFKLAQRADPKIRAFVFNVSRESLKSTLTKLQSYFTRNSRSGKAGLNPAARWAAQLLKSYGFNVTRDRFRKGYTRQIIAELAGVEDPDKIVVLGAHLDSTAGWFSSPTETRSPGADDNGSGSTSLLEFARIVGASGARFRHTLRLCLFTGEEQGLLGSRALAKRWRSEGQNIIAMFNSDMMGHTLEGGPKTIAFMVGKGDQGLIEIAKEATRTYVPSLAIADTTGCCSDQQSFWENGFPACGFFETPGRAVTYPAYHKSTDLLRYLNLDQIELQAKAAHASTALLAEIL